MTHDEFVKAYKSGQITAAVNRRLALRSMKSPYVAKRYKTAHLFWTWIWFLSIPAGILLMIFVKWWIGLLVFIIGFLLPRAIKESSTQFVLEQALEDEKFYQFAIEEGLLVISKDDGEFPEAKV
jgi:hypothetical protein